MNFKVKLFDDLFKENMCFFFCSLLRIHEHTHTQQTHIHPIVKNENETEMTTTKTLK